MGKALKMSYTYDRRGAKKPNPVDQANAAKWEAGGRKKFVAWAEHKFLPAFEAALTEANSFAGEIFGESVFDKFLQTLGVAELRDFGKHFGYPGSDAKDNALMSMWGQALSNLRYRHPDLRGKLTTPTHAYEHDYTTMKGLVHTLKSLG